MKKLEDFPDYMQHYENLNAARRMLAMTDRDIQQTHGKLAPDRRDDAVDEAAVALLEGKELSRDQERAACVARLETLYNRRNLLHKSIQIGEKRRSKRSGRPGTPSARS